MKYTFNLIMNNLTNMSNCDDMSNNNNINNDIIENHNTEDKTYFQNNILSQIIQIIDNHKDDINMLKLLNNNLAFFEQNNIEQNKIIQERELRKNILENEKKIFVDYFLSKYNFYYIADSDIFITFINKNNGIHHLIL
jgi:hypothetical protein